MSIEPKILAGDLIPINRMVDFETALTALCVWEAVCSRTETKGDFYRVLCEAHGTGHFRHFALTVLAPAAEAAWLAVQEQLDVLFDWEFVPLFLECVEPYLITRDLDGSASRLLENCVSIGKDILEQHQKEGI